MSRNIWTQMGFPLVRLVADFLYFIFSIYFPLLRILFKLSALNHDLPHLRH